jgi:hypothetical protein
VAIGLPVPRQPAIRTAPAFSGYVAEVMRLLERAEAEDGA